MRYQKESEAEKGGVNEVRKAIPSKKVVLLHILIEGIMTKRHLKDTQIYPKVNLSPKLESKAIHTMIKNTTNFRGDGFLEGRPLTIITF